MKIQTNTIPEEMKELIKEIAQETASCAYQDNIGGTVNYFRVMESLLYNYKKLEALVADEAEYIQVEYKEKSTSLVAYSSSSCVHKTKEDILEEMKQERIVSFQRTKARFDEVDRVVKLFQDKKEFHVIRMYYFDEGADGSARDSNKPYTWDDIATELSIMGYVRDTKSARRWRNNIVNDMAVCLFGKPAAISSATYKV